MINGGPAYPLAASAVRVLVRLSDKLTVAAAVLSGDLAGLGCNDDPQVCNPRGTTFSFAGGALVMGELQYTINQGQQPLGLPGVYHSASGMKQRSFPTSGTASMYPVESCCLRIRRSRGRSITAATGASLA